jgi:hypothetical protein
MMRTERRRRSPARGPLRGGADVEHGALGARCDSERRPRERRRLGRQAIDVVIRVRGVVVKRHQVPDIRQPVWSPVHGGWILSGRPRAHLPEGTARSVCPRVPRLASGDAATASSTRRAATYLEDGVPRYPANPRAAGERHTRTASGTARRS